MLEQLKFEKKTDIVGLFCSYFDTPELLAASILWLLSRGLSPLEVIQTGLLQAFLIPNLDTMHIERSRVEKLYFHLSQYDEAAGLIELSAKTYACRVRVLAHESEASELNSAFLALNGTIFRDNNLINIPIIPVFFDFTESLENFINLESLFGSYFFERVLRLLSSPSKRYTEKFRRDSTEHLKRCFSLKKDPEGNKLAELIEHIVCVGKIELGDILDLLRQLSEIIDDDVAKVLNKNHPSTAIHLANHFSVIADSIIENDINGISQTSITNRGTLLKLYTLKGVFPTLDITDKMLTILIDNPPLRADKWDRFLWENKCIEKKINELVSPLLDEITSLVEKGFTSEDYPILESNLKEREKPLDFLYKMHGHYLNIWDVYRLRTTIINAFFVKTPTRNGLSEILDLVTEEAKDKVEERQQTLIEVIVSTIGDTPLRDCAISMLQPTLPENWTEKTYGSENVLEKATKRGNLQFIEFILKNYGEFQKLNLIGAFKAALFSRQYEIATKLCDFNIIHTLGAVLILTSANKATQESRALWGDLVSWLNNDNLVSSGQLASWIYDLSSTNYFEGPLYFNELMTFGTLSKKTISRLINEQKNIKFYLADYPEVRDEIELEEVLKFIEHFDPPQRPQDQLACSLKDLYPLKALVVRSCYPFREAGWCRSEVTEVIQQLFEKKPHLKLPQLIQLLQENGFSISAERESEPTEAIEASESNSISICPENSEETPQYSLFSFFKESRKKVTDFVGFSCTLL